MLNTSPPSTPDPAVRPSLDGLTMAQLKYFAAVAAGETFADAAAGLGVSQSALSQGIARLEQIAGSRLLERDGRRRRLTAAGDIVAEYAARVLGETETLADDLIAQLSGARARIRVGLIDAAALYLFRDEMAAFRSAHPGVVLEMTVGGSEELEHALAGFRLDVAIVVGPAGFPDAIPLVAERLHVYGTTPRLEGASWALYPRGSRTRAAIDAGLAAAGIEPRVAIESGNPAVLRELARLTASVTVLPTAVVEQVGDLRLLVADIATRQVLLVTRPARSRTPVVAELIAALTGSAG